MTAAPRLSGDPRDKFQAVLNRDWPDPDDHFGADYRQACAAWFAGLSERDKSIALKAAEAYASGYETRAEEIAAELPAAPVPAAA
jgi:hypothetical protein